MEYLGVSYGLTGQLLRYGFFFFFFFNYFVLIRGRFWKRLTYVPLYIGQRANDLTGEHTCVMVRGLNSSPDSELEWLAEFAIGSSSRDSNNLRKLI